MTRKPFQPGPLKTPGNHGPVTVRQWTNEEKERVTNLKPLRDFNGKLIGRTPDGNGAA